MSKIKNCLIIPRIFEGLAILLKSTIPNITDKDIKKLRQIYSYTDEDYRNAVYWCLSIDIDEYPRQERHGLITMKEYQTLLKLQNNNIIFKVWPGCVIEVPIKDIKFDTERRRIETFLNYDYDKFDCLISFILSEYDSYSNQNNLVRRRFRRKYYKMHHKYIDCEESF